MASTNPANFANLPKDELKEIAAKGGHASHGAHHESSTSTSDHPDRNPDGTFTKGSELAKELGAQGGHAVHHHRDTTGGANSNDSGVGSVPSMPIFRSLTTSSVTLTAPLRPVANSLTTLVSKAAMHLTSTANRARVAALMKMVVTPMAPSRLAASSPTI